MDTDFILHRILDIYLRCGVKEFPLDCLGIIGQLGIRLIKYSELSDAKRETCMLVSQDAFKLHSGMIYYNAECRYVPRQRFTLMHELGHIVLGHVGESRQNEDEANYFASNILAPRVVIHKSRQTTKDIQEKFGLSCTAANIALDSYKAWYDRICRTTRKPTEVELRMEELFFPDKGEDNLLAAGRNSHQAKFSAATEEAMVFFERYQSFDELVDSQQWYGSGR